jgi:hypothetical protein
MALHTKVIPGLPTQTPGEKRECHIQVHQVLKIPIFPAYLQSMDLALSWNLTKSDFSTPKRSDNSLCYVSCHLLVLGC